MQSRVLSRYLEAAHMRREEKNRPAGAMRGEGRFGALDLPHHRDNPLVRQKPHRGQFGEHLSGGGNGLAPRARIRVAGLREICAHMPTVSG